MRYRCGKLRITNALTLAALVRDKNAGVRLDQNLVEKATIMGKALNRTMPKQIEHWAKIGEMMEDNPDLPYEFVKQAIISKAEKEAGKLEPYDFG